MPDRDNATNKKYLPSFGVSDFQVPMCILTVFAHGGSGKDCSAYRGIIPLPGGDPPAFRVAEVRRGGQKIKEAEARKLFDFGELVWRP